MADHRDAPQIDWYAQLDVRPDASSAEIAAAYRRLARTLHPDSADPDAVDVERLQRVIAAHQVLSNPASRRAYDDRQDWRPTLYTAETLTRCPVCRGEGLVATPCSQCRGSGHQNPRPALLGIMRVCDACRGTGSRPTACGACAATGYTTRRTRATE